MRSPSVVIATVLLSLVPPLLAREKAPSERQGKEESSGVQFAEDVSLQPSDLVTPVAPVKSFPPNFPKVLKRSCGEGSALVRFVIGRDGSMSQLKVVKATCKALGEETLRTVAKWQFKPATINGQPVAAYFQVTLNFKFDR